MGGAYAAAVSFFFLPMCIDINKYFLLHMCMISIGIKRSAVRVLCVCVCMYTCMFVLCHILLDSACV